MAERMTAAEYETDRYISQYPHLASDREALVAHVALCHEVGTANQCSMDPARYWGQTREQIESAAVAKGKMIRRGRGARALRAKYGDEIASNIISQARVGRR